MGYATDLQFAQVSGLGVRIVDETVGTGDNSATEFDLENDNTIDGTYVFSHAASGVNNLTPLTETTHYTFEKESGRINLTSAGVTAVGTDIIYSTYTYIDGGINDTLISQWSTWADSEVDLTTKRNWGTPTAFSEYFDGRATKNYPSTDRPFSKDWDSPDYLIMDKTPITGINYINIMQSSKLLSQEWSYDDSGSSYVDNTDEANSVEGTAFKPFGSTAASDDVFYVGCDLKFYNVNLLFATAGVVAPGVTWEYYDGSSWTSFSPTDNSLSFTMNGTVEFSALANWQKTTVNSSDSLYFIRATIDGAFTTPPTLYNVVLKDVVSESISLSSVDWESWGKISFTNYSIPNGTRNVLVNYNHGYATTPALVSELAANMMAVRAYVYITGGSFDDVTSAQLGSKQASVGEPYINMRESLNQQKGRVKDLVRLLGQRYDVVSSD